jgi:N-carbamoylputrescine amidase
MTELTIAAVSAPFGRDLDQGLADIEAILDDARASGAALVVLPEAALGGYLHDLSGGAPGTTPDLPPALDLDGPVLRRVAELAGDLVVCVGFCESDGTHRYNSAACVHDGAVLGSHRKVHLPLREDASYDAGEGFQAFATPVGRLGMLICYDKAFPESGRLLALDGADIIACLSAWPGSRTAPAATLAEDRWTHRFDLYDRAGALQNQVVWASANQSGTFGDLRFVGSAKVVGPGGDVLAATGTDGGTAIATVDVDAAIEEARRGMSHLRDRRPDRYGALAVGATTALTTASDGRSLAEVRS